MHQLKEPDHLDQNVIHSLKEHNSLKDLLLKKKWIIQHMSCSVQVYNNYMANMQ